MPPTSCPRMAVSAATLAFTMRTILPGSSLWSSQATPVEELLDSYASERKPVADFTVEQAFARYVARTAPWLASTQQPASRSSMICRLNLVISTTTALGVHLGPRTTAGMPGSRAPHLWLTRSGQRVSTIDLTGDFPAARRCRRSANGLKRPPKWQGVFQAWR